jgi:hypothetical protein
VRAQQFQQGVGQIGGIVVEPVLHPRGEEGHAFEQALDMGVVDGIGRDAQAPGHLRVGLGELTCQLADRRELAVVVGEQGVGHGISSRAR